jgi:hypothetical protein
MSVDYNKHVLEGWKVQDFIDDLDPQIHMIMRKQSHADPFENRESLKKYCMENQPYYKKYIKEVVDHFCKLYAL